MNQSTGKAEPARAMFEADVASHSVGIELVDTGAGRATARMRITEQMLNGHAIAHGGYLFLLADTAFACACNSYGPATVAAGAEISFVGPGRLGDTLIAVAEERTRYGRNGICDVRVCREGRPEEVLAEFRGHSRTVGGANGSRLDEPDSSNYRPSGRLEER